MLIFGVILAAVGGLCLVLAKRAGERVHHIKATDTTKLGDLLERVAAVRKELGEGPSELREYVELKGKVACAQPLRAEVSGQVAAIVQTTVTRDTERYVESRDSQGNLQTRWEKASDTVHSARLSAAFQIDDGSGRIDVRPDGADTTLQTVVDRMEQPAAVESGYGLRIGALQFGFQPGLAMAGGQLRVLGYRIREEILPVGAMVYMLGEASDTSDGLALHKPGTGDKPFLISVKSEAEMVQAAQSSQKGLTVGGYVLLAGGVVLAIVGMLAK
jgi:hypothetical protein